MLVEFQISHSDGLEGSSHNHHIFLCLLSTSTSGGARNFQFGGVSLYGGVGAEPLVRGEGVRGATPLKLKALSLLGGPLLRQIYIILGILQSQKTTYIS